MRNSLHREVMREAAVCSRMKPKPKTIPLTPAQVQWLNDPRPYSHPWRDRTFRALIDKGVVIIDENNYDRYGTGRCAYILTDAGRASLKSAEREVK